MEPNLGCLQDTDFGESEIQEDPLAYKLVDVSNDIKPLLDVIKSTLDDALASFYRMFHAVSSIDGANEVVDLSPSPSVLPFPSPDPRSKSHWKLSKKDGEQPHKDKDREKDGEYFGIVPSSPQPHFVVDRSTWTSAGAKNPSSAAKSREHDWERLHRRFTWLPKLTIQKANDNTTNDLVYKPTDFSGPHHWLVDVGFRIAESIDVEYGGSSPQLASASHPSRDTSSITWKDCPSSELRQRHVLPMTHNVEKASQSMMLSFEHIVGANCPTIASDLH